MTETPPYRHIVSFSESFLDRHGPDSPRGVGWARGDADTRYRVMLDVIKPGHRPVTLLDFGCGLSNLYDFILRHRMSGIDYAGLDVSPRFLSLSRQKYPQVTYYQTDVLDPAAAPLPPFDYVVLNGIFNYKGQLSHSEMLAYLQALVRRVFGIASIGIAFNVITKQVEWEREDLFHLPVDPLLDFLSREVSRHVVIRHDYGLFEYTAYVYQEPSDPDRADAKKLLDVRPPAEGSAR